MKKIVFQVVLILMVLANGFAQESQNEAKSETVKKPAAKSGVSFSFGGIIPSLQLNDVTSEIYIPGRNTFGDAGCATFGASFGLKYNYIFKTKTGKSTGVGLFLATDVFWNPVEKSIRDFYDTLNCTPPNYVNIPIMAGVSYNTQFSRIIGIWVEVGCGANLFLKTPEGWENEVNEYKLSYKFGAEAGVGILLIRTISIGAHYYWLGEQDIVEDRQYPLSSTLKMGAWALKLGFHF